MTTPNMGLTLPSVAVTGGPEWASLLNAAIEAIDAHTHQSGSGVLITPAAININATVEFNSHDLSEVNSVLLDDRTSNIAARGLFAKNGELQYRDTAGNVVPITAGGSVNAGTGSISGLSAPASALFATNLFTWSYAASKFARMANADIILYPYDASTAYTKSISLKAPAALEAAASYNLTLPSIVPPSSVEYLSIDTSGNLDHATFSGTSNQVSVSASATAITLSLPATTATTQFSAAAGSVSAPAYTITGDTDTGMYATAANRIAFTTGGTQALLIDDGQQLRGLIQAAASPTWSFTTDSDTGMYSAGANILSFAAGGSEKVRITNSGGTPLVEVSNSAQLGVLASSAAVPGLTIVGDLDTGFYGVAANSLGVSTAGTLRVTVDTANVTSTLPYMAPAGAVGAPGYTFSGDSNTGIYSSGADTLDFATLGSQRLQIDQNGRSRFVDGTAGAPALSFLSDTDTGIYRGGANQVSVASNGVHLATFTAGQVRAEDGSAASPMYSFLTLGSTGFYRTAGNGIGFTSAATSVGTWTTSVLNLATPVSTSGSGGTAIAHKTTIVTSSLASGGPPATVFSGATVYGVYGWIESNGIGGYQPLSNDGTTTSIYVDNTSTSTSVKLSNGSAGTRAYTLYVVHA